PLAALNHFTVPFSITYQSPVSLLAVRLRAPPTTLLVGLCRPRTVFSQMALVRSSTFSPLFALVALVALFALLALRGLTRLPWISGALCREFAGSPVCPRLPDVCPRVPGLVDWEL